MSECVSGDVAEERGVTLSTNREKGHLSAARKHRPNVRRKAEKGRSKNAERSRTAPSGVIQDLWEMYYVARLMWIEN